MDKIDEALKALVDALGEEPVFIEFEKARLLVQKDPYLVKTEQELKSLQQKITQNVMDKAEHNKYKREYETLKKAYDEHPYVLNYNALLNEVNELLLTIKTIIE